MKQQHLGIIFLVLAIALGGIMWWFTVELNSFLHTTCLAPDGTCPHEGTLPPQSYLGFTLVFILGVFAIYMLRPPPGSKEAQLSVERKADLEKTAKTLESDEQAVFNIVLRNGLVFQSKLVSETGFSKVKVTRILDRLEAKRLIERRRRGMSNVVVAK